MSKRPSLAETLRQVATSSEPPSPQTVGTTPAAQLDGAVGEVRRFYASTRAGKKKVTATLAPADHKRLRQLALEHDATTEALLSEAISDLFAKYGKASLGTA